MYIRYEACPIARLGLSETRGSRSRLLWLIHTRSIPLRPRTHIHRQAGSVRFMPWHTPGCPGINVADYRIEVCPDAESGMYFVQIFQPSNALTAVARTK